MDQLKKYFPLSFKKMDSVKELVIGILTYVCVGLIAGLVIWLGGAVTGWIPVVGTLVGWVLKIVGAVVDIYVTVGVVLQVLVYLKVVK